MGCVRTVISVWKILFLFFFFLLIGCGRYCWCSLSMPNSGKIWRGFPTWNQGTPSLRQSNSFVDIMGFICAKNWTQNYFQPSHGHYGIVDWESKPPNWIKCRNEQSNSSWILVPAQSRFRLLRNGMSVSGLLQTLHATRSTFHGATFEQKNEAGLGVGICNQEGLVMASLSQLIQLPPSTVIEV